MWVDWCFSGLLFSDLLGYLSVPTCLSTCKNPGEETASVWDVAERNDRKQPRCTSADEWIRKLWYICTMEYYPAIQKNTFESVLMRWMKLEPIIQSEVSQKDKHQYSILMHVLEFRKMVMITLYARQKKRHRCIKQTFGLYGRRRAWDDLREQHRNMYIIKCETDHQSRLDP